MDFVTVLECKPPLRMTKVHSPDGSKNYDQAKWFKPTERKVKDLSGLLSTLEDLSDNQQACLIRGRYNNSETEPYIQRKREAFPDQAHNWVMFDVDSFDGTVDEAVKTVLPKVFHDASYIVQHSPSSGIKPGLRVHLWFWLAKPATSRQLKSWAKTQKVKVDLSVFAPVQPHYIATPVFENMADPVLQRLEYIESWLGQDAVDLDLSSFDEEPDETEPADFDFFNPPVDLGSHSAWDYLSKIDPTMRRSDWLKIGMAIHHQFEGSEDGYELFDKWSSGAVNYEGSADTRERWDSFSANRSGHTVTFASVIQMAGGRISDLDATRSKLKSASVVREAVHVVATAKLTDIERNSLLQDLRQKVTEITGGKVDLSAIRREVMKAVQDNRGARQDDLQLTFVRIALDRHWASGAHITRFGKLFWIYDSGAWRQTEEDFIRAKVMETVQYIKEVKPEDFAELLALMDENGSSATRTLVDTMLANLISVISRDGVTDPLRLNTLSLPSVMNCKNGELWFDDKGGYEFRPHNPENMFVHQLRVEYKRKATCPEWDKAIARIFQDMEEPVEAVRHFYEICGYLLQLERHFAIWLLFHGTGSNGKSFVMTIIQALLDKSAVSKEISELGSGRNAHIEAGLVGKLAVIDDDFKRGALLPDGMLKKLSEAKQMTANPKFGAEYNFVCRATPIILSNGWPATRDLSFGMARRAMVFDFNTTIVEDEKDYGLLGRILANELPGILNHLVAGWSRLKARGKFDIPRACITAAESWTGNANSISTYLAECYEITKDSEDLLVASEVYEDYARWAAENVGREYVTGRRKFYQSLREIGLTVGPGNQKAVTVWGLKLQEWYRLDRGDFEE